MDAQELQAQMTFRREGAEVVPIFTSLINGSFIIAVYAGSLSPYDLLIKYRQKQGEKWSRLRTPKHIHWTVDILIKMQADPAQTRDFLNQLLAIWEETTPLTSEAERQAVLSTEALLDRCRRDFQKYQPLGKKGEYPINFLLLLAKLLMIQEKTNLESAYMFKNLLRALEKGDDLFSIVSIATHGGRR